MTITVEQLKSEILFMTNLIDHLVSPNNLEVEPTDIVLTNLQLSKDTLVWLFGLLTLSNTTSLYKTTPASNTSEVQST